MTAGEGNRGSGIVNRSASRINSAERNGGAIDNSGADGIKFTKRRSEDNLGLQDSATAYLAVAHKGHRAACPYNRGRIHDNRRTSNGRNFDGGMRHGGIHQR
jgi:hypothetical protein